MSAQIELNEGTTDAFGALPLSTGLFLRLLVGVPASLIASFAYMSLTAGGISGAVSLAVGAGTAAVAGSSFSGQVGGPRVFYAALIFFWTGVAHAVCVAMLASSGGPGDYWPRDLGPLSLVVLPVFWAFVGLVWAALSGRRAASDDVG